MDPNFWQGKKVYLTGHTGFKGSWLSLLLDRLGSKIYGYALSPPTVPNLFEQAEIEKIVSSTTGDIRHLENLHKDLSQIQPEIVIHLAAQSLVRESYLDPVSTFETNIMGTVNILEAVRKSKSVKALIIVTSDKCYKNREQDKGYVETDELGGHDPYSSSKACAELVTDSYQSSFFNSLENIHIASVRAGNVIGGGDWAADRLIPDLIRSFTSKKKSKLRHPNAIRPWQHVLEPLFGYLRLIEHLFQSDGYSGAWNFGPSIDDEKSVRWIADKLCAGWGDNAAWDFDDNHSPHETNHLHLNCHKAITQIDWRPELNLERALDMTISWYKKYYDGLSPKAISKEQIDYYLELRKLS